MCLCTRPEIASQDAVSLFFFIFFQKRTVKKSQEAKPKPKKDSDIVRERIIRRAALEFEDGMYGILLKRIQAVTKLQNHITFVL